MRGLRLSCDSLNSAAFSSGVATFEQRHDAQAFVTHLFVQFHQFDFQVAQLLYVFAVLT
jgi:hypothetical protein